MCELLFLDYDSTYLTFWEYKLLLKSNLPIFITILTSLSALVLLIPTLITGLSGRDYNLDIQKTSAKLKLIYRYKYNSSLPSFEQTQDLKSLFYDYSDSFEYVNNLANQIKKIKMR